MLCLLSVGVVLTALFVNSVFQEKRDFERTRRPKEKS